MKNQERVERLLDAVGPAALLRISRLPRNADRVDGFVLAAGPKWVLVSQTGHGGFFDGLVAVRIKDVARVRPDSSFQSEFARTQPEWPPTAPSGVDLAATSGLIQALSAISPLIGIEQERRHDSMMWIGVVREISAGRLWLRARFDPTRRGTSSLVATSCAGLPG